MARLPHSLVIALPLLLVAANPESLPAEPEGGPSMQESGMEIVAFFHGTWDVESLAADGVTVIGRARTEVAPILDGRALKSDYFGLNPGGGVVFRGTTIRTWAPSLSRFIIHWVVAEQPDYTHLIEEYRDGELIAEGHGQDAGGDFLERYRYFGISDSTYSFEGTRSYDEGATWNPFAKLRATKRAGE